MSVDGGSYTVDRGFPVCTCPAAGAGYLPSTWIGAQRPDFLHHFGGYFGKARAHRRRQVDHTDTLAPQANFLQQTAHAVHSLMGIQITFQVMTFARQSAGNHHAVGAVLEGTQQVQHVKPAGAG